MLMQRHCAECGPFHNYSLLWKHVPFCALSVKKEKSLSEQFSLKGKEVAVTGRINWMLRIFHFVTPLHISRANPARPLAMVLSLRLVRSYDKQYETLFCFLSLASGLISQLRNPD